MKKSLIALLFCFIGFDAVAQWEYKSDIDQMRETTSHLATMTSNPINNNSASDLTLIAASNNNKTVDGIGMYLLNDMFDCDDTNLCKISVKFNKSKVLSEYIRLSNDQSIAHFVDGMVFVETIRIADSVFIEVPIRGKGLVQYKFNPSRIKWNGVVEEGEYITSIGDINFINPVAEPSDNAYTNDRGAKCNLDKNFSFGVNKKFVGNASICFDNKKLVYVEIDNIIAKRNDLIQEINKARKENEDLNGDTRMWLNSDDGKYLSKIYMSKSKNGGYHIFMLYQPNINIYTE